MTVQTQQQVVIVAMWGAVVAAWLAIAGLFILAITHDGAIATQVADAAVQLVMTLIAGFSGVMGIHVWKNSPNPTQAAPEPPAAANQ